MSSEMVRPSSDFFVVEKGEFPTGKIVTRGRIPVVVEGNLKKKNKMFGGPASPFAINERT